ncbi:MAG: DUF2141 domain-containing protein [Candidatus Binatus sp.]
MRMKLPLIAFALLLAAFTTPASSRAQDPSKGIKVEVIGFRNDKGLLRCSLWSGPDGFPRDGSHIWKHASAPVKDRSGECVFGGNIPAGDYAVTIFHDEDASGKFKSNFIGYPLEGYGFSNNVNPQFKAPGFDECKFLYDGSRWKQIPIKMIYR